MKNYNLPMFKINHYNSCNTLQLEQLLEHMNNSLRFEIRFKNILEAIMYLPKKNQKSKSWVNSMNIIT